MKHPARYSDAILDLSRQLVPEGALVLDPFAGTGRIHELEHAFTFGIEIEPEWAEMHPRTILGDALELPSFWTDLFDVIVTSPTYGNRMADHHEARDGSRRITYRHVLGRPLHENNSGGLQWGEKYRDFHQRAWAEAVRVLRPGGLFILNISDHVRRGKVEPVSSWHVMTLEDLGLTVVKAHRVATPRMRFGANATTRVDHELVIEFTKGQQ